MFKGELNFNEFSKSSYEAWLEQARNQLRGNDPEETLKWSSIDHLDLNPYYATHANDALDYLRSFELVPGRWMLIERIEVESEKVANTHALEALNMGAEGIHFILKGSVDLSALTQDLLFEYCRISFEVPDNEHDEVAAFMKKNAVNGFISADFNASDLAIDVRGFQGDLTDQYAGMLNQWLEHPGEVTFIVRPDQDFFHAMAGIRALRYLTYRLMEVGGLNLAPHEVWIHAEPEAPSDKVENWFTHCTAGMAALIGGVNSVCFHPGNNEPRISRNVGNLLRHESRFETLNDFGRGSYFIESLTDQLIKRIWEKLQ